MIIKAISIYHLLAELVLFLPLDQNIFEHNTLLMLILTASISEMKKYLYTMLADNDFGL